MNPDKCINVLLVVILLLLGITPLTSSAAAMTLNGDTPWVVMEADYQNLPIQKAIRDVERDWYKVFGYPPVIFHNKPASSWNGPVVVLGSKAHLTSLIDPDVASSPEHYHLYLDQAAPRNPALIAAGSDTRGTIYAIYTLSENILGIDPMYIFTDSIPAKRSAITLDSQFDLTSTTPTFEYRGWFINDEELHDGLHRDPLGGNVIAMEWMDKILETLLRCKANMIIPESAPYPDATVYDLCKRRGVVVTHHHVTPVGLNMMNWPRQVPYSYITHKDILVDAWTKAVKAQIGQEIVWVIGFRGQSDGAFWNTDPAAPRSDAERAAVIADAMQTQTDIIRSFDPDATIVAALWNEQGRFFNAGLLKIPDRVCRMFADDGRGFMRDEGGKNLQPGDGLYYHVMMMMNTQNRTTEAVPPARFYHELKRYVENDATKYAIINVSGIRPAAMSVEAITDFLWNANPALSQSPQDAMKAYLHQWYAREFSPDLASRLTDLRLKYYDIPYMREKMPFQGRWRGARAEHLLQYLIQEMLKKFGDAVARGQNIAAMPDYKAQLGFAREPLPQTAEFFPELWKQTCALKKDIPPARQKYYQFHFIWQVAVHMYSAKALSIVTDAFDGYARNPNPQRFADRLTDALDQIEAIIDQAHQAEYGIWDTMFMHVRLMDIFRTRLLIKATIAKIEKKPYSSKYRGFFNGSFWRSAHEYMDTGDGVFPYFYKHSGPGLECLEKKN